MIRRICNVQLMDMTPTADLLSKLGLEEITSALGTRRLRWYGHVCRSDESGGIKRANKYAVPGSRGRGRPRKTWNECVKKDILERGLSDADPGDRLVWRAAVNASRLLPTPETG